MTLDQCLITLWLVMLTFTAIALAYSVGFYKGYGKAIDEVEED